MSQASLQAPMSGQCHCGAVRFTVHNADALAQPMRCNCSLCRRKGAIMGSAPLTQFEVTAGADKLSLYQWNTGVARHYFCSICGIYTHHQRRRRPDEVGFNVACLDGIDLTQLTEVGMIDGQTFTVEE